MEPKYTSILRRASFALDPLESRSMLCSPDDFGWAYATTAAATPAAFSSLNINFQKSGTNIPSGFKADIGSAYGDRGNGFTYGWNVAHTADGFDRNSSKSPTQQYDTGIFTQRGGNKTWELAVRNGKYRVTVLAGDPWVGNGRFHYVVEGITAVNKLQSGATPWVMGTVDVTVSDGKLTIANGSAAIENRLNSVQITTLSTSPTTPTTPAPSVKLNWNSGQANPISRFEAAGAAVGTKLYVFGGYISSSIHATARVDVLDTATGKWTRKRDMPQPLTHAGQVVDGNYVYLVGGFLGDNPGPAVTSFWKYNTLTDTYTRGPALPQARGAGGLAIVGRKLYYAGGLDGAESQGGDKANLWTLDLASSNPTWQARATMPQGRNHFGMTAVGNKLYVIGGQSQWNEYTGNSSRVDVYDITTNKWSVAASMPQARGHLLASTFGYNGMIYTVGGATNGTPGVQSPVASVMRYNPASNAWQSLTGIPAARMSPVAAVIGNKLWVTTGNSAGPTPQSSTWYAVLG